jgi:CheY-like chemotaxis protein
MHRWLMSNRQSEIETIRGLIVGDQPSFRRQLRQLLTYAGLVVVDEVADVPAAGRLVEGLEPDVAVVDVMLLGINDWREQRTSKRCFSMCGRS